MNPWWWVPIGLAAWFLAATVAGLLIGPVLAGNSCEPEWGSDEGETQ